MTNISRDSDIVEIISVFVGKAARGQGVGSALMAAILAEVKQVAVFRKAILSVNAAQGAAVGLYGKFGFEKVGEITSKQGDGQQYPVYIMEKKLGAV